MHMPAKGRYIPAQWEGAQREMSRGKWHDNRRPQGGRQQRQRTGMHGRQYMPAVNVRNAKMRRSKARVCAQRRCRQAWCVRRQ